MSKFYLFAYEHYEAQGGMHDYIDAFDSIELAEQSLLRIRDSMPSIEDANIGTIDEHGNLVKVRTYWFTNWYVDNDGYQQMPQITARAARWTDVSSDKEWHDVAKKEIKQ